VTDIGIWVEALHNLQSYPSPEKMQELEKTRDYTSFMVEYESFCEDTRAGKHGTNAQFWINYIDMVDIYMLFSRAVRTNDVDLFIFMLGKMIDIFFAANRHNYARYMCLYYLRLLNMDTTHPGVRRQLEQGGLSVRLSSNSFTRQPVTVDQAWNVLSMQMQLLDKQASQLFIKIKQLQDAGLSQEPLEAE
jgi:hypothetical protein